MLKRWASHYANQPDPERALEPAIAALGIRYRVQHPLWGLSLFLDFALPDYKVAIEVDGDEHRTAAGRRKDKLRTAKLNKAGWAVVRCTNEEALADPVATVARLMADAKLDHLTKKPN